MIEKLSGRDKVNVHKVSLKINEIIEIMTRLSLDVEVLKKFKEEFERRPKK